VGWPDFYLALRSWSRKHAEQYRDLKTSSTILLKVINEIISVGVIFEPAAKVQKEGIKTKTPKL
jgi:hypothetical protein